MNEDELSQPHPYIDAVEALLNPPLPPPPRPESLDERIARLQRENNDLYEQKRKALEDEFSRQPKPWLTNP